MENLILLVHLLIALAIIGLILMQRGKGAEMGASFGGGSSQTLFGASGSGNFFSKMTALLAFLFFVSSFSLAIIAKQKGEGGIDDDIPTAVEVGAPEQQGAADDEIPEAGSESADSDIPEANETNATTDEIPESDSGESAASQEKSPNIPE